MPRTRKPLGLHLTEQDVLDQLPAMAAWQAPPRPLPGPGAWGARVTITVDREPGR